MYSDGEISQGKGMVGCERWVVGTAVVAGLAIAMGCTGLGRSSLDGVVEIATGGFHTCARNGEGAVFCWGMNNEHQVTENGEPSGVMRPARVDGLSDVRGLAMGSHHSCAVEQGGSLVCWGNNSGGQLGDGTQQSRTQPTPIDFTGSVVQISASSVYTCVRTGEGSVWCTGEMPAAVDEPSTVFTPLDGLEGVIDLSVTNTHGCAVHQGGGVSCWGGNFRGELGDGTTVERAVPVSVPGLTGVAQIATGERRTCARMADGTVQCWGYGGGQAAEQTHPVPVPGLQDVAEIGLGEFHQCARHTDGSISCWGDRFWGQLGDGQRGIGSERHQAAPVRVLGIDNAVQLAVGGRHSCALLADGTVNCWGYNVAGALGDGSSTDRFSPVAVP